MDHLAGGFSSIDLFDLELIDALKPLLLVIMIVIALALGVIALRIVSRPAGLFRVRADDPYFFPIGETPTIPHEAVPNYRRHQVADDFRTLRLPEFSSAGVLPSCRKRAVARSTRSGTATVLTLQPLRVSEADLDFLASRQFQVEEIARAFGDKRHE